jgi:hypothetical protein
LTGLVFGSMLDHDLDDGGVLLPWMNGVFGHGAVFVL